MVRLAFLFQQHTSILSMHAQSPHIRKATVLTAHFWGGG